MAAPTKPVETKVPVPGRPPEHKSVEDNSEPVNDLTKAEQAAGKKTLKAFEDQLKLEQETGKRLVAKAGELVKARLPKQLSPPQSGSRANPLHGNPRE